LTEATFALDSSLANFDGKHPYGRGRKSRRLGRPSHVGSYLANPLGLCDMHGNVWEWCQDWFADYHNWSERQDPQGPPTGSGRVLRGGSWVNKSVYCRAASRVNHSPDYRFHVIGFRVVQSSSSVLLTS
jgi:formylglycine-generating enzyme required for sulfatase activity